MKQTKECVINIPTAEMAARAVAAGPFLDPLLQRTEVSLHPVDADGQAVFE